MAREKRTPRKYLHFLVLTSIHVNRAANIIFEDRREDHGHTVQLYHRAPNPTPRPSHQHAPTLLANFIVT